MKRKIIHSPMSPSCVAVENRENKKQMRERTEQKPFLTPHVFNKCCSQCSSHAQNLQAHSKCRNPVKQAYRQKHCEWSPRRSSVIWGGGRCQHVEHGSQQQRAWHVGAASALCVLTYIKKTWTHIFVWRQKAAAFILTAVFLPASQSYCLFCLQTSWLV